MDTYFVFNGLLNGESGVYATTTGFGIRQKDGWYYLPEGATDGVGPFPTEREALEEALEDEV